MKILYITILALFLLILSCAQPTTRPVINSEPYRFACKYYVDLNDRADDLFKVTLELPRLRPANNRFNFAAVGSFARMDFGRYVRTFKAFDSNGAEVPTRQVSTNQWQLSEPSRVSRIYYEIAETWDTPTNGGKIMEMLGTTLEQDFAFISGQGVFGFVSGLEGAPLKVTLDYPSEWTIGTSHLLDTDGSILCPNFGALSSAPILLGYLTHQAERIIGSDVYVYCYSKSDRITTDDVMPMVQDVLTATYDFLGDLPIDDYTMLFIFEDTDAGGVEYHNSSAFVFREDEFSKVRRRVQDVIAHEYFHLIIPFSIRSDILDKFNFFKPTPTQHLWFFEGVTEWASDIIQLRGGLKSMDDYILQDFRQKLFQEDVYGADISLRDISLTSHQNQEEYLNVYSRGALVAALLDIHLLDLTHGRRGLRDVIVDLSKDYGKERPLPEEKFFEILIDYSGPEVEDFIRKYIIGNAPLPTKEVLETIGIIYDEEIPAKEQRSDLGMLFSNNPGPVEVLWVNERVADMGIKKGDVVQRFNGRAVHHRNYSNLLYRDVFRMDIGDSYEMEILRDGRPMKIVGETIENLIRHAFSLPRMLTPQQQKVRMEWLNIRP